MNGLFEAAASIAVIKYIFSSNEPPSPAPVSVSVCIRSQANDDRERQLKEARWAAALADLRRTCAAKLVK